MIIGTIVTRYADGSIDNGGGCDTAPASLAVELSRKSPDKIVEFTTAAGVTYYRNGDEIVPHFVAAEERRANSDLRASWTAGGQTIRVVPVSPGKVRVEIDGVVRAYNVADLGGLTAEAANNPEVRETWREIERRAVAMVGR